MPKPGKKPKNKIPIRMDASKAYWLIFERVKGNYLREIGNGLLANVSDIRVPRKEIEAFADAVSSAKISGKNVLVSFGSDSKRTELTPAFVKEIVAGATSTRELKIFLKQVRMQIRQRSH
ncbi:MAG: hypothetical protein J4224_01295 [Candidatus Diapherotrites archaeon]|uniref:Uncharacterized protein n=1 Tax=Candidatus Iainarchaeum sp. TaxID=3101447 RepID=A0A7J4ITX6_9ARCH|nr:MAG: hypothetical protein QT03_C0001G1333 [archaeon GW2011_AR10]MBS3059039.1 hypothetical protein [Candidatus Diapherotrites archaeon]HIH08892.1 hypothetical protein [Candidatus Diapherotrites archaeon]